MNRESLFCLDTCEVKLLVLSFRTLVPTYGPQVVHETLRSGLQDLRGKIALDHFQHLAKYDLPHGPPERAPWASQVWEPLAYKKAK